MSTKARILGGFHKSYLDLGPIRLRRYDDILSGEADPIEQDDDRAAEQLLALKMVEAQIAEAEGISPEEAHQRLFPEDGAPRDASLLVKHYDKVSLLLEQMRRRREHPAALITLFMQSRGELQNEDGSWESAEDWTEQDTARLPKALRQQITAFIEKERLAAVGKATAPAKTGSPPAKTRRGKATPSKS